MIKSNLNEKDTMRNLPLLFLLLTMAAPARDALAADAPKPRNLLVITADDMNADSGGWNGAGRL